MISRLQKKGSRIRIGRHTQRGAGEAVGRLSKAVCVGRCQALSSVKEIKASLILV